MQMDPIPDMSTAVQKYVVGFMFSGGLTHVALIRKNKPAWQRGKLNGIGGKIESDEIPIDCMIREFYEESKGETCRLDWKHFCSMYGGNDDGSEFRVEFFASTGDLSKLVSAEAEKVGIYLTQEIYPERPDVIENLPWLIALAIDHLKDGRPSFVTAKY